MVTEHSIWGWGWEGSKKILILQADSNTGNLARKAGAHWICRWDPLLDTEKMVPYMEIIDQPSIEYM